MNIIVVGRGWTGKKVFAELQKRSVNAFIIGHNEITTHNIKNVNWIVNCAGVTGYPNVDACEDIKQETLEGNAIFPISLYNYCQKINCRLAHFSSGCIYTGIINDVNAAPNFFGSIYSISKGVSDTYLKDKALVFRIRMPFTNVDEPKNYLTKVRNYALNAKLIDSGENSLTDHDEAIRVACDLILENADNGPYNLVNQGSITMKRLADVMKLNCQWFTEEDFLKATKAARSNCVIPAYEKMRPLDIALKDALNEKTNRI
jgi:dTDP-4-dehydrorhamnose reductase